jgi:4-hydroxybutyrate CoA-transferase
MTKTKNKQACASAEQALELVQSGQRVFVHGAAATPTRLLQGLIKSHERLSDVELIHLHTFGDADYAGPRYAKNFRVSNLFVGQNMREQIDGDRIDYLPCFLSEIPNLFRSQRRPLDVALIHVSPPDEHGYCSLGTSVDVARAAVDSAKIVIAQINAQMPRVHGDGFVHISRLDRWIEIDEPIIPVVKTTPTPQELEIGRLSATLIEDGSTLQMGIGSIPDAVLASLHGHRHLGIHSEMWTDGAMDLIRSGAVDNSKKVLHPGKSVSGFVMGTQALYDFIDDNPSVLQLDIGYVNSPHNISLNPKVVAINSAVEVDLTGQVCADSIGNKIISGVGGQMDFIRGASLSAGGKPIIAITSRTKRGASRIVSNLKAGAGVVTTRSHVHYVITEFGIADLYGKTLGERARELIKIAHPDDRERLERERFEITKQR